MDNLSGVPSNTTNSEDELDQLKIDLFRKIDENCNKLQANERLPKTIPELQREEQQLKVILQDLKNARDTIERNKTSLTSNGSVASN